MFAFILAYPAPSTPPPPKKKKGEKPVITKRHLLLLAFERSGVAVCVSLLIFI